MNPESINSVIDHLADKLAIPTGQLMAMLPRLGYKSAVTVIWFFFAMIVSGILTMFFLHIYKKYPDSDTSVMLTVLFAVVTSVCLLGTILLLPEALFWLHDPQAWALDYVLKMLR